MKHLVVAALLAGVAVGCGPVPAAKDAATSPAAAIAEAPAPGGACTAEASIDWEPAPGLRYVVTGAAGGPTCNTGRAVLTIRDGAGRILLVSEDNDVSVMANTVFAEALTPASLQTALVAWIDPGDDPMLGSASALPEWKDGLEQPSSGEFPFYPREGMTRKAYADLRLDDKPLYCHVQGGESMACYVLDAAAGTLSEVGLQTFPG